jgi:hypothetical protein
MFLFSGDGAFRALVPEGAAPRPRLEPRHPIRDGVRYTELSPDRFKDFWR